MVYSIGFLMEQVAGHVTNYRNVRSVAEIDPDIRSTWHEIYYRKEGGMIERVRDRALPFVPTYFTGIMRATVETQRALRHQHYDALMSNLSVGVFFSPVFRRTPTLIDFDSTPRQIDRMTAYNSSRDIAPLAYLKWRLAKHMFQSAAVLQAWSNWAKQSVVEEYHIPAEKIIVNPPGVNLQFWKPGSYAPGQHENAPRRILFVGGDFKRKGGDLLLQWYRNQDPGEYELHIVTREPVAVQPGIHVYHDMQPNTPRLLELYQTSDLFVLPSLGECFGVATVEAMAAGLPVIASDIGGTADIIEPGRNGFIIPSNDVQALSESIAAVFATPSRAQTMGKQSRLLAEERFDLQRNARNTLGYLKEIAALPPLAHRVAV